MEFFNIVDENGVPIGKASREECHSNKELLHPVVHLIVQNSDDSILLQLRAAIKKIQPGKWDTSVGGHIQAGETVNSALQRETLEELGIDTDSLSKKQQPTFLYNYIMESDVEREYVYTFFLKYSGPINFLKEEIDEVKFWSFSEINKNLHSGVFTPNFEDEFVMFMEKFDRRYFKR